MIRVYPHNVDVGKTTIRGLHARPRSVDYADMAKDPEHVVIGERLRAIREGFSDLNQVEWAEKHQFGHTRYNNWEKGTRRIPVEEAEKLCQRYGLTLDAIYRGRLDGLSEKVAKVF